MERLEKELLIVNRLGLHARAATKLAQLANRFNAQIMIHQEDKSAMANSVMGLMMLESHQGKVIRVVCEGKDAKEALIAITELVEHKFDESE